MSHELPFQPFRLKHLTSHDRRLSIAHELASIEHGLRNELNRRHRVQRAKGGIGLTSIVGSTLATSDGQGASVAGRNLHAAVDDAARLMKDV